MITVIGTGTGAPADGGLLDGADLVVGGRRHLEAVRLPEGVRRVVLGPLPPALDVIERYTGAGRRVVVLASGDPGFFGIVRALAERFGAGALEVRPGVSSVAAAFARAGLPWDDAVVVSAHGRELRTAVNVCRARPKVAVLTGPGAGPAELGAALARTPSGERVLVVATALGDPGRERVERVTPAEAAARDWGTAVNVVLCLDEERALGPMPTLAGPGAPGAGWALEQDAFACREAGVTTAQVRALALARLGPRQGDLVWDVGAGTGPVAVECARFGAAVVAVAEEADGAARARADAAAHGVDVAVVQGAAPGALSGLADDPDAVFVGEGGGGRGGDLPVVVSACARRARRTVVVALAAPDRVPAVRQALTDAGLTCDGVELQASRLAPRPPEEASGPAADPVFLLWGVRPPAAGSGPGARSGAATAAVSGSAPRSGSGSGSRAEGFDR
ncbi:precorrin-6y C5,15-methyltransferase (decarboxylating) subunit CbiE [Streptomyces sp. NPDC056160]|uniref:precorrin-6y C5,15-methyltransferase (decarboxylating) subunit CbiE n=1 Tax=Streptomyces sp. NPDC056160 TaxID=3345731 RepID=UPI0035D6D521